MKKRVFIRDKNRKISYKGRVVRTPVTIDIHHSEIEMMKMMLKANGIEDYSIDDPVVPKKVEVEIEDYTEEEPVIEEIEPNTILGKLAREGE